MKDEYRRKYELYIVPASLLCFCKILKIDDLIHIPL